MKQIGNLRHIWMLILHFLQYFFKLNNGSHVLGPSFNLFDGQTLIEKLRRRRAWRRRGFRFTSLAAATSSDETNGQNWKRRFHAPIIAHLASL